MNQIKKAAESFQGGNLANVTERIDPYVMRTRRKARIHCKTRHSRQYVISCWGWLDVVAPLTDVQLYRKYTSRVHYTKSLEKFAFEIVFNSFF